MKDVYLRHRMDKEGYLPVSLIASFNRVQALTQDITFIVQSVKDSEVVEVKDAPEQGNEADVVGPSL